ncbi:hypothetical protein [Microbispora amethystogenes]|uniref:hypothetical protein n=1 Tax=Microbispora amethystogenes TaxID=1427754 RepID=UPI001953E331|nr:hypothetical protein [Microbispora amethystogenes]
MGREIAFGAGRPAGGSSPEGAASTWAMSHARLPRHNAFWMPIPSFATLMETCWVPRLLMGLDAESAGCASSLPADAPRSGCGPGE